MNLQEEIEKAFVAGFMSSNSGCNGETHPVSFARHCADEYINAGINYAASLQDRVLSDEDQYLIDLEAKGRNF